MTGPTDGFDAPDEQSPAQNKKKTKTLEDSKTKKEATANRQPFSASLVEFADALRKDTANSSTRAAAFRRLAVAFARDGRSAVDVVLEGPSRTDGELPRAALLVELCLSAEALERSQGESAAWARAVGLPTELIQLASSACVSSRQLSKELNAMHIRRKWLAVDKSPPPTLDPRLRTTQDGLWAPAVPEQPMVLPAATVEDFTSFLNEQLPLGREAKTRTELVVLAQLSRSAPSRDIAHQSLGIACLERLIVQVSEAISGGEPLSEAELSVIVNVFGCIGRQPDVWAKVGAKSRKLLQNAPESTITELSVQWATVVAATWFTSEATKEALESVSNANLAALLRAATDHMRDGLLSKAREILNTRAMDAAADDELWTVLAKIPESAPLERAWITPLLSKHEATTATSIAYDLVLNASSSAILSSDLINQIIAQPPAEAIPALARAHARRRTVRSEESEKRRSEGLAHLRALHTNLDTLKKWLDSEFGEIAGDLGVAFAGLASDLSEAIARLRSLQQPSTVETTVRSPRFSAVDDLELALRKLEFDPARSAEDAHRYRNAVVGTLFEAVRTNDPVVERLFDQLPTFTAEGVGAIWEVAVLTRQEKLLAGKVSSRLQEEWALPLWLDILVRHAGHSARALPINADEAEWAVAKLAERLKEDETTGFFAENVRHTIDRAENVCDDFEKEMSARLRTLGSMVAKLSVRFRDGTETRN
jgi:hypothetical protein